MKHATAGRLALLLAALALPCPPAHAAGAEQTYAMRGLGGASCENLTTALEGASAANLREALGTWITGYLSARNEVEPDTFDVIPLQDPRILSALVEAACKQNPASSIQVTLSAVVGKLSGARAHHDTPAVQLGTNDAPLWIRTEILGLVQTRLTELGLMTAPASLGSFDQATGAALTAYQTQMGLKSTGLPDDVTLLRLLATE